MKRFEFEHHRKLFDKYYAPYVQHGLFVQFETGEVMVPQLPRPDQRRLYPEYDVELVATNDPQLPELFLDKERTQPVKRAWLQRAGFGGSQAQQYLAIDWEQGGITTGLTPRTHYHRSKPRSLPDHMRDALAAWMGPHRQPLPLATIEVSQPNKKLKKSLHSKLQEVRQAVVAAYRVMGKEEPDPYVYGSATVDRAWADMSVEDVVAGLDELTRTRIAASGFSYPRAVTRVEYLYAGKEPTA